MKILNNTIVLFLGVAFFTLGLFSTASAQRSMNEVYANSSGVHPTDFRKGYLRLGINSFVGNELNYGLSPHENVREGNLGANMGFNIEMGRNYYFNNSSFMPLRFGLDWTVLSLNYNDLAWGDYSKAQQDDSQEGLLPPAISLSSKLGPVVSFNPLEELIIDVRIQGAVSIHAIMLDYYNETNDDYYTFMSDSEEFADSFSELAIYPSFGITLRRKAFGLSADYFKQNVIYGYTSRYDGEGTVEFPLSTVQLKLNFSFNKQ